MRQEKGRIVKHNGILLQEQIYAYLFFTVCANASTGYIYIFASGLRIVATVLQQFLSYDGTLEKIWPTSNL